MSRFLVMKNFTDRIGRKYLRKDLENEVEKLQEIIIENKLFGEIGYATTMNIDISQISHKITKLEFVGEDLYVEIETLPTPKGLILQQCLDGGITMVAGIRAIGKVDNDYNVTELQIATIDMRTN